jgi:caffeoyl-CoA O-methyltransferase
MSELHVDGLNSYIDSLLPVRNKVLLNMEELAAEKQFPIVGPQVGRLLFQLARLKKPADIFEMGSGFGYSACWFALGAPSARIILTDRDQSNLDLAKTWLKAGELNNPFEFRKGNALDILKKSNENFDIILVDIGKEDYPETFKLAMVHLRSGGLLITDNVLWHGRVFNTANTDAGTKGVRAFNHLLFETDSVFSTILPVRDGVAISLKL